jgi:Zn-dependent protease with chaperone function
MRETLVAAALAMMPALAGWVLGLPFRTADRDQAPLYRLRRKRLAQITTIVILSIAVFFTAQAFWALPLALLARGAGWFRARKTMLGERWGLGTYAAHSVRVSVAHHGFWILLYATPIVVVWYPPYGTALWPVFGALLALWVGWSTPVTLALLGARRLDRHDVLDAFRAVSAGARGAHPSVWVVPAEGGTWTAALALPDTRRPAVVFSTSMLERLDADELAAIYAHEVAHLEQADPGHIRRYRAWTGAFAGAAMLAPLVPIGRWTLVIGWTALVAAIVVWRVLRSRGDRRREERQCDAQALRLGASPQALERALVKIHAAGLIPERWTAAQARLVSHPSLAERVANIRHLQRDPQNTPS